MGIAYDDPFPGSREAVADRLLALHRSYLGVLRPVLGDVHAMAHIAGGGLPGNLNRVLPPTMDAAVDTASWEIPNLFRVLAEEGAVQPDEMYRAFNMGVGMRWRWSTPYRNRILQQRQGSAAGWAGEDQFERANAADLAAVREIQEPARWSVVLALGQGSLDRQLLGLYGWLFVQPAGVILRHPRRQPPGLSIRIAREALDRPD